MIGHYLLTLTVTQEERVLTRAFQPICTDRYTIGATCLLGCATADKDFEGGPAEELHRPDHGGSQIGLPGFRYESLCRRFGTERVNAAIRNRILTNQARRVLAVERRALRGAATPTEPPK